MRARIIKFLVTGAIGITVNLGSFQIFLMLGMYYVIASALAFSLSTIVGFILQRFWTFQIQSYDGIHRQFVLYVGVVAATLVINTGVVYGLVEYFDVHHLIAQAVGAALVACFSYIVYSLYIFKAPL